MSTRYYTRIYCNGEKIASIGVSDNYVNEILDDFGFSEDFYNYNTLCHVIEHMYHTLNTHEYGVFRFNLQLIKRNNSRKIITRFQCPYFIYKVKNIYWLIPEAYLSAIEDGITTKEWIRQVALAGCEVTPVSYYHIKKIK